jgi:putative DNA primase/helicase
MGYGSLNAAQAASIKLIPFTTRIPEEKQDKYLERKLKDEASGILNWLLEGARWWAAEGLNTPPVITSATDVDVIGNFIREQCAQEAGMSIRARELFKCYQAWCEENNEHACSERFLGLRLKELGLEQKQLSDGRYWKGVRVIRG